VIGLMSPRCEAVCLVSRLESGRMYRQWGGVGVLDYGACDEAAITFAQDDNFGGCERRIDNDDNNSRSPFDFTQRRLFGDDKQKINGDCRGRCKSNRRSFDCGACGEAAAPILRLQLPA
jgi:hypothetical protein